MAHGVGARSAFALAALVAGTLVLASCGGGGGNALPASTATPAAPAPPAAAASSVPPATTPVTTAAWSCRGWCWPLLQSNDGSPTISLDFADAKAGLALRANGKLERSDDGGQTWQQVADLRLLEVQGIRLASPNVAYAWTVTGSFGTNQTVYRSADGGRTWAAWTTMRYWGTNDFQSGPIVLNAQTVIVARENPLGESAITDNGGISWRTVPFLVTHATADGVLLGQRGRDLQSVDLWRSDDAGVTSRLVLAGDGANGLLYRFFTPSVYFALDRLHYGLVADDPKQMWVRSRDQTQLYLSADAGNSWTWRESTGGLVDLRSDGSAWAEAGPSGTSPRSLWRSTDWTKTWQAFVPPAPFEASQIYAAGVADEHSPWFQLKNGERKLSTDNGLTWRDAPPSWQAADSATMRRSPGGALYFLPPYADRSLVSLMSADDGRHWRRAPGATDIAATVLGVAFADANRGYATLSDDTLLETTDGGGHWERRAMAALLPEQAPVYSLSCFDYCPSHPGGTMQFTGDGSGWLLFRGHLLRSTDRGRSWAVQAIPGTERQRVIAMWRLDADNGWVQTLPDCTIVNSATSCAQALYVTKDGGRTWRATGSPRLGVSTGVDALPYKSLMPVAFASTQVGAARVDNGLLFTIDGGASWQAAQVAGIPDTTNGWRVDKSSLSVTELSFVNSTLGWAMGKVVLPHPSDAQYNASLILLLRTNNGGQRWDVVPINSDEDRPYGQVSLLRMVDAERGWALVNGFVYAISDGGKRWSPQDGLGRQQFWTLHPIDAERVWAGGERGALVGTSNGGRP